VTAKMSEAKRRAFLKALKQTGNATLAAEQAGMSRSWVSMARRGDAGFDAACRAARAAAAERLGARANNRPPRGWGQRGGADLALCGRGSQRVQVVRAWGRRWTPRAEARFLGLLPATCNLGIAAGQAGMTVSSLEAHLRRWPDFRRRVEAALATGRVRLEAALKAEAERPFDPCDLPEPAGPLPTIDELIRVARRIRR
jgi:hypothetical protein